MFNFFNRLQPLGKAVLIFLVVGILGAVAYFSGLTKNASGLIGKGGPDATIIVNTYCGFGPIVWANGGLEGTDDSWFSQKYGLKLKIIIMDDFDACRASLKEGSADIAYCTLDALPVEMSASGGMTEMRYFMLLNFSAGADAIVANSSIQKITDLKGKQVAYAEGTASHTLLLNTLETSGLSMNDIQPVKVGSGLDAAQAFKAKQVDAALVWAPDDEDCIAAIPGAKVLTSTAQANSLVSDGLIAKKDWLDSNRDLAIKIAEAIIWANSEIKFNKDAFAEGAKAFAEAFETDVDFAMASSKKINYATLQDEANWLGLNSEYPGMKGEQIYTKMSRAYSNLGLCKSVLPWSKVAYTEIIEALLENNNLDNTQTESGTKQKEFTAPTQEMETVASMSDKKVTINFPTAGYTLDNEARSIIDREFVDIAKEFGNCRIRVEGNTDNTGNYESNVRLSKARAQAVVDYLVSEYSMSRNRFIVVGNGPKKALSAGVTGESEAYRTTDFQLISE